MITQAIGSAAAPLTLLHGSALQPKGAAVPPTSGSGAALAHVGWSTTSQHSIFGNSRDLTSFPASSLGRHRGNQACQIACSTLVEASPPAERKLPNPETILPAQHALEEKEEVQGTAVENCDEPSTSGIAVPSPFEVQSLLMQLCDETSIAELSLKVGDFQLRVLRDVNNLGKPKKAAYQVPISAPHVPGGPMMEAMESPASANGKALSLPARPMQSFEVDTEEEEDEVDEGLLCVLSPKVGVFRRGRFVKGKRGRPMVVEGQMIKTGQVIGYLEQLGTQQPIESEHAGEVVRFPVEDDEPVGYGERLVEIRPSFPGIKKLSS